jgi:hypothetical protein
VPFGDARLLHTLRNYPDTEDFVYLRRVKFGPANYNPYALEVSPLLLKVSPLRSVVHLVSHDALKSPKAGGIPHLF